MCVTALLFLAIFCSKRMQKCRMLIDIKIDMQVFDDVAVEMALALLQFFSEKPPEVLMFRGLQSLLRCCVLARAEVTNDLSQLSFCRTFFGAIFIFLVCNNIGARSSKNGGTSSFTT